MNFSLASWRPPGPVAAAYVADDSFISAIMGPIRSGKTNAGFAKRLRRAMRMPRCQDGVIRYSFVLVRDTYGALYETTIRSWHQWFPPEVGKWSGSEGRPATHELLFDTPRGPLELRARFLSIQSDTIENLTRGLEFTDAELEEADLLPENVLTHLVGRVGQWPQRRMLPPGVDYVGQVDCVTNPPDVDSWFYKRFVDEAPLTVEASTLVRAVQASSQYATAGQRLFRQPSGLSPQAENLANIGGRAYYERLADANRHRDWWVRRMVHGEFGPSRDGEPVFPEFSDNRHVPVDVIQPLDIGLRLGLDAGVGHPAASISQWAPGGQWRTIDELVPGRMGATRFGGTLRDFINDTYRGLPVIRATADPSSAYGADREAGELAWYEQVAKILGVPILLAPTNEISPRLEAKRQLLMHRIDGEQEAYALSRKCRNLRKGYNSGYRYKLKHDGGQSQDPLPDKNAYSHAQDAEGYAVLDGRGLAGVLRADRPVGESRRDQMVREGRERAERTGGAGGNTVLRDQTEIF